MNQTISGYPALDEIFTLTITTPFTGLEMVKMNNFCNWDEWEFNGKEIIKPETSSFKLIQIGNQSNLESVKKELVRHGVIPEGQWCDVFHKTYKKSCIEDVIGVADASWFFDTSPRFPCLDNGHMTFNSPRSHFNRLWRWLIKVPQTP